MKTTAIIVLSMEVLIQNFDIFLIKELDFYRESPESHFSAAPFNSKDTISIFTLQHFDTFFSYKCYLII